MKLSEPGNRGRLLSVDQKVCDALLREIDSTNAGQTRERLHLAIYGGKLPHCYEGKLEPVAGPEASTCHSWRHLISTFYNFHLAGQFASRPVLNSKWFEIPDRLMGPIEPSLPPKLKKIGEVPLETPLYPEYLTIPFLPSVRGQAEFWKTMRTLETSSVSGDECSYEAAFKEHLRIISSLFAKHLKDNRTGDLVTENSR
jgi:hypothetical protein